MLKFLLEDLLELYKTVSINLDKRNTIDIQQITDKLEVIKRDLSCLQHKKNITRNNDKTIEYILENYLINKK